MSEQGNLGGGWGSALTQLAAFAGLGKRESHSTHEEYNFHTQVLVVLAQFAAAVVLIMLFLWALWIGRKPMLMMLKDASGLDWFLPAVGFMALGIVARFIVYRMMPVTTGSLASIIGAVLAVMIQFGAAMTLINLFTVLASGKPTINLLLSMSIWPLAALGAWRFAIEVWNPRYPPDKSLDLMNRLIDQWTGEPEQEDVEQGDMAAVWRSGGQVRGLLGKQGKAAVHLIDLRDFMERGSRIGFSRNAWCPSGVRGMMTRRHRLPSGSIVSRRVLQGLLAVAERHYGWLVSRPGVGYAFKNDVTIDVILAQIDAELEYLRSNGHIPDWLKDN